MNESIKGVVYLLACVLGAAALTGCGAADTPAKPTDESVAAIEADLINNHSGGGDGFVCGPTPDGGTGCVCWEDDPSPIYNCDGMMRFCDLIGPGMICSPSDNTCSCRTWMRTTTTTTKSQIVVGTIGGASKLAAP